MTSASPGEQHSSVIAGTVRAGPTSPVSRPGQDNSRPVAGRRVEVRRGDTVAYISYTDHEGRFRFTVRPGTYVIVPDLAGFRFARPQSETVTAVAGHEQLVRFLVDTGIR
jgi:hypothetical protein